MYRLVRFVALAASLAAFSATAQERQVYDLPQGAHPHGVAPAPDGNVWDTVQHQGALGILDPETGKVRQVPLGEGSRPHGVIQGPDGGAWITDGGLNAIVRFDPKTEKTKVWALPEDIGTPISIPELSTATASSGSPGRTESMGGSIPRRAT